MVLEISFYTKDPDGVGDIVNIFLFPDLTPADVPEAALMAHHWEVILGGGELTSFADTRLLTEDQNVITLPGWEAAAKKLE